MRATSVTWTATSKAPASAMNKWAVGGGEGGGEEGVLAWTFPADYFLQVQVQRQEPGGPVPAERPDEAQGGEDGEAADR